MFGIGASWQEKPQTVSIMCRIAGAYDKDNIKRLLAISGMTEYQHRGGPDARGVKTVDDVTFGHNRLSIIDLTQLGEQPQRAERYMITYNGEIYNFKDFAPLSRNDTQAILYTIENKGIEATLPYLNGMFAIGIYDKQEKQIHCIVDRFAQKPLYYYHKAGKFYFASWPAALYDLEDSWELDRDALQSYWLLGSVMGENSLFKGIKKLNASEWLSYDIKTDKITIKRYWQPQFQDHTNGIEDLVFDAIDKTKVSDVPIHIFLSGGIDSTLVASRFTNGQAVHLDSPERQYAEQVAHKFNIDLKVINPTEISAADALIDYSRQTGEPTMAGLIPYITAKEVSKHGKVAITANGADELFFGYDRTSDDITGKQLGHILRISANFTPNPLGEGIPLLHKANGRHFELLSYVQFDLNKTLDFASMCHGLEVRAPFLDHRLVEMALSIHEKEHRAKGNKTILKQMLWRLGFTKQFTDRPKQGFSLHYQPANLPELIRFAWQWVKANGYLTVNDKHLTPRDKKYLEMSALGFYYWFQVWNGKIR